MTDESMLRAAKEAVRLAKIYAYAKGGTFPKWKPPSPDEIRAIRKRMGLSQAEFCTRFGFKLSTLKSWERRRRVIDRGVAQE